MLHGGNKELGHVHTKEQNFVRSAGEGAATPMAGRGGGQTAYQRQDECVPRNGGLRQPPPTASYLIINLSLLLTRGSPGLIPV